MKEKIIVENGAPPGGPYSPAIRANGLLFISGQIPLNPETGKLVTDSIQNEVRQTLENIKVVVESAGSTMDNALKCTVYLRNFQDFQSMNEVYATYFPGDIPPTRTTVEVSSLAKGVNVEIDMIALG